MSVDVTKLSHQRAICNFPDKLIQAEYKEADKITAHQCYVCLKEKYRP